MAKSKVGGSRAYIRGRIGADVYSIGKDGKGTRQQVVRSLAEQVSNPRTESQMFGRMVMSTVMQAVSALQPIIDHSFDGLPKGQPNISEFIRQNYALVKADATAHPANGNQFGLSKYQEKGVKVGHYVISNGSLVRPLIVSAGATSMTFDLSSTDGTVGGLKQALGLSEDGFLTFVVVGNENGATFVRAHIASTLSDDTKISSENVAKLFEFEGNSTASASFDDGEIEVSLSLTNTLFAYGIIVSDKVAGAYQHSKCVLKGPGSYEFASNVALPTYPTGSQMFLNGGDL